MHIPYGHQNIDEDDIDSVVQVLRSDYLTTGPKIENFENRIAKYLGVKEAIAVSSGTAALHCVLHAIGIKKGDEVIVPTMTFASTVNAIVFMGALPVFVDVNKRTLLIDIDAVKQNINANTKAIIAVDYAGQPCDYNLLYKLSQQNGIKIIADACHSLGATYHNQNVGQLADLTVFSMHPVKAITSGEGGVITTENTEWAKTIKQFRNNGILSDYHERKRKGSWVYDIVNIGYNYRITDFQCALGISQLHKLSSHIKKRQAIASLYNAAFESCTTISYLDVEKNVSHAYHLYVIRLNEVRDGVDQQELFSRLTNQGIGVNVHYKPVHLHTYYQKHYNTADGMYPVAEKAYKQILSLPIYPTLSENEVEYVITNVLKALESN